MGSDRSYRVMLSSTFRDLKQHRAAVIAAATGEQMIPLAQEFDGALPADLIKASLDKVQEADVYVGMIASRYGQRPDCADRNTGRLSLTDLEYRRATERRIPRLMFIMADDHPLTLADNIMSIEEGDEAHQLRKDFISLVLKDGIAAEFSSPDDLKAKATKTFVDFLKRSASEAPTAPAPGSENERLLHSFRDRLITSTDMIRLPLVSPRGEPVTAPIGSLRVDLPLRILRDQERARDEVQDVLAVHEELRGSHTEAVSIDRASRHDDFERNCSIGSRLGNGRRAVVVGDPGCGKSTLLQWIANHYARNWNTSAADDPDLPSGKWFPILIECRELSGTAMPDTITSLFAIHLRQQQLTTGSVGALTAEFERMLVADGAILLIDSLDEIPQIEMRKRFCSLLAKIANQYPEMPILVTSRVVGFDAVSEQLHSRFDILHVGPLDNRAKRHFVQSFGTLADWSDEAKSRLFRQVTGDRTTARLADNVLLLALIAQMRFSGELDPSDQSLPLRRVDVYRRVVEIILRQRSPRHGPPLTRNEVFPHLEFLAYEMRQDGVQRVTDKDVVEIFKNLRDLESEEGVLATRSVAEFLSVCIDTLGFLSIAGTQIDERGYERKMVQFYHQSFQEYFAAQALKHDRGGIREGELTSARIPSVLSGLQVTRREVSIFDGFNVAEPVLSHKNQEMVRMLIADLPRKEADAAIELLLQTNSGDHEEARARAVFAMQCLADEPALSDKMVDTVFGSVISALGDADGFNTKLNTLMDEAIAAVAESGLGPRFGQRLIADYVRMRGPERNRIGCCAMLSLSNFEALTAETADQEISRAIAGLSSALPTDRVSAALRLTNQCFVAGSKLEFLSEEQRHSLFEALGSAVDADEATMSAAMWAVSWLCGARFRNVRENPLQSEFVKVPTALADKIEQRLHQSGHDEYTYAHGVSALNREDGVWFVSEQQDWVYNLAVIADGGESRRNLEEAKPVGKSRPIDRLLKNFPSDSTSTAAGRFALGLGDMGVFSPVMVPALEATVANRILPNDVRSHAALYLGMIGSADATAALVRLADTPPQDDDIPYSRSLFALLYADDVDVLSGQIRKALPHSDINAYAYGLAGSRDPRGRNILESLASDANQKIRDAAQKALEHKILKPA